MKRKVFHSPVVLAVLAGAAGLAGLLSGCTLAPDYHRPSAPVPEAWPEGDAYAPTSAAATDTPAADVEWRTFYPDDKLRQVIETALARNRDLRVAALHVERARALYGIQRDELLPAIHTTATGGKQRSSADLVLPGQSRTAESYQVNFGVLSWEIDFFGRLRCLKDSALQQYLATEQARRSAQILLVSSVARAYLALAADREALALAERTVETQTAAYDLVRRQHEHGIASELDLRRAETTVETARRAVARYTLWVAQSRNALNLLAGAPVPEDLLPDRLDQVEPPQDLAPGTSSEVLLGRPDVQQAEALLRAAYADLGAARAAFFPRISLVAAVGTASDELEGLFKTGTGTWSYAPQIVMPIFDARTWSAHEASRVQRKIAVANYENAIQNAFREVADALADRGTVDRRVAAQQALVRALSETHRLSRSRFEQGIDSYLGVLDAERSLFAAEQELIGLRLVRLASRVTLYAVAGGGWRQEAAVAAAR